MNKGSFMVQSLAIAASPSWAAALESSHRFFGDWPITMPAEPLVSTAKLRTEGSAEQNRVAVVCKGEAAIASACICLPCGANFVATAFEGKAQSIRTVLQYSIGIYPLQGRRKREYSS
jgi:hypothetical protein